MKTREELEKLSLPDLLTYIEEMERKVAAGAELVRKLEACNHKYFGEPWQKDKNFDEQVYAALEVYRNAK